MGVRYGAAHIIAFVCIACRKGWVGDDADISGLDSPPTLSLSLSLSLLLFFLTVRAGRAQSYTQYYQSVKFNINQYIYSNNSILNR